MEKKQLVPPILPHEPDFPHSPVARGMLCSSRTAAAASYIAELCSQLGSLSGMHTFSLERGPYPPETEFPVVEIRISKELCVYGSAVGSNEAFFVQ